MRVFLVKTDNMESPYTCVRTMEAAQALIAAADPEERPRLAVLINTAEPVTENGVGSASSVDIAGARVGQSLVLFESEIDSECVFLFVDTEAAVDFFADTDGEDTYDMGDPIRVVLR